MSREWKKVRKFVLFFFFLYNPAFDSQKRKKVVQSPSIKALSHFFALLRIIVFFSYLLFDV